MENNKNCTVYYNDDGYIVNVTGGWYDEELGSIYNTLEVFYADPLYHYISDGIMLEKQDWEPVVSGNTIHNIPNPSKVFIKGESLDITDGVLELDKPVGVEILVVISPVSYTMKEVVL